MDWESLFLNAMKMAALPQHNATPAPDTAGAPMLTVKSFLELDEVQLKTEWTALLFQIVLEKPMSLALLDFSAPLSPHAMPLVNTIQSNAIQAVVIAGAHLLKAKKSLELDGDQLKTKWTARIFQLALSLPTLHDPDTQSETSFPNAKKMEPTRINNVTEALVTAGV